MEDKGDAARYLFLEPRTWGPNSPCHSLRRCQMVGLVADNMRTERFPSFLRMEDKGDGARFLFRLFLDIPICAVPLRMSFLVALLGESKMIESDKRSHSPQLTFLITPTSFRPSGPIPFFYTVPKVRDLLLYAFVVDQELMCFTRLFLAALPLLQPPSTAGLLWLLHFVCLRVSRLQSARWRSSCSAFPPFHPPSVADCPALHFVCVWVSQPGSRFRGGRGVPQDNDARESWAGETPRTIRKPFLPSPCSLLIDRPAHQYFSKLTYIHLSFFPSL